MRYDARVERFLVTHRNERARPLARLVAVLFWGLGTCCVTSQFVAAQVGAPRPNAPSSKPSGSAAKSGSAATTKANTPPRQPSNDSAARNEILQSRSWQDALQAFNDWLSNQVLYDDEEVRHIRARLDAGIDRMSADQLQIFMNALRERMAVLTSDRALDAQDYLAEKFLVASDAYARKIRQQLPDVLSMTATEIDRRLSIFASKRQSRAQAQNSFEQSRDRRLASNSAQVKARQQQRDRISGRSTAAVSAASTPNNFTPSRDYFPAPNRAQIVIGGGFY
jgi:hypothetical protein